MPRKRGREEPSAREREEGAREKGEGPREPYPRSGCDGGEGSDRAARSDHGTVATAREVGEDRDGFAPSPLKL